MIERRKAIPQMIFTGSEFFGMLARIRITVLKAAAVLLMFGISSGVALGWDEEEKENLRGELPQLSEMKLPEFDELMQDDPYDWVVLKNGSVIVSMPVYPRPDTLESIAREPFLSTTQS